MFNSQKEHATVAFPKPQVHATHPFRHEANMEKLRKYVLDRMEDGKSHRDDRLDRLVQLDRTMAGWIQLSDEDREAVIEAKEKGKPIAQDLNLPLTFIHLDDMMTYFSQTFAPNRGMFYQNGSPAEAGTASQIVTLMNNHAVYAGYYRQTLQAIFSILKYNMGGFTAFWSTDYGPKLGVKKELEVTNAPLWSGNKIEALDMYNTFWDPSVHPTEVYKEGEFAGMARLVSRYWLQTRAGNGVYFNLEEVFRGEGKGTTHFYVNPPYEASLVSDSNRSGTDWVRILSPNRSYQINDGYELVEVYIRLNPTDFGLVEARDKAVRNRYEIWKITMIGDKHIIGIQWMNNIHNHIPCYIGLLNDDLMVEAQKSVGEIIAPLQDFASHLLNVHMRANRKNLWGVTWYDSTVFDMSQVKPGTVSARIPTRPEAAGRDLTKSMITDNKTLDTRQTMQDFGAVLDIINQFFPTSQLPNQIASIDRAVTNQVAAVQQGTNRRNQKSARLLDDSLFRPLRFGLYYNIVQFQEDGVQVSDFYGKPVQVDLTALRATDLPFIIGQGLKSIDRQAAAEMLKEIIFVLLQNPMAVQQMGIGMIGLLNYWVSMLDIDVDLTQFMQGKQPAPNEPAPTTPTGPVL